MLRRLAIAAILVISATMISAPTAWCNALITPDWDEPFFEDYSQSKALLPATVDQVNFTLPVLGFATPGGPGIAPAIAGSEPLGERLSTLIAEWPNCARPNPNVSTVPANADQSPGSQLGTWFTSTYDFDCFQVMVEGDQNIVEPAAAEEIIAEPESGSISISRLKENGEWVVDLDGQILPATSITRPPGDVLVEYRRGGLTYGILITCQKDAENLCRSDLGVSQLVGELKPLAGNRIP